MSPENIHHKLMGVYMEVLILVVILSYIVSAVLAVSYRVYRVKQSSILRVYVLVCGSQGHCCQECSGSQP